MDKHALKILFDAFWSKDGWKRETERGPSLEDFSYAKSKRFMFDPVELDHTQALKLLFKSLKKLNRRKVTDAFLASLSTRRLDWRSALGSYAVFQHLPVHIPGGNERCCNVCGLYVNDSKQDFNVLNFERFKWGGVRHDKVVYAAMDLGQILEDTIPTPTTEDIQIFHNILSTISAAPASTTSAMLHSLFAKSLKSNKSERDTIVAILGFCGILGTPDHPGYSANFVPVSQRELPDRRFIDMSYPACWWQGDVGINKNRLVEYFGHVL